MFRRFSAAFLVVVLLCAIPMARAAEDGYSDVPAGGWAAASIEKAAEYGLMQGVGNGAFGYGMELNRASFIKVLCNMFDWAQTHGAAGFTDTDGHWAEGWIAAAAAHGAVEPGGAFRPEAAITREEMAVMLVRALDYDSLATAMESTPLPFPDVREDKGYIALAWRFGIINGITENDVTLFKPDSTAPREQAAAMLVRAYERYTAKIDWLHGFYALESYGQIDLSAGMDAVSVGWARLDTGEGGIFLNQTAAGGNDWKLPQGATLATDYFTAHGTNYHLGVACNGTDLTDVLADEASRGRGVAAIAAAVHPYGGITIDFEGLRGDKKDAFTAFMTALRAALPGDKGLWVAVQTPDWYDGFDYRGLGEICDKVILMAHDYKSLDLPTVGAGSTDNPVSPIAKVCKALAAITDPETGVRDRSKIALALSMDSAGYEIDAEGRIAAAALYNPGVTTLTGRLRQGDAVMGWSDTYRNAYVTYKGDDGKTYKVWYEDARGVTEKVKLAAMFGITGVSVWRLGTLPRVSDEGLHYDVWDALQVRR